jgi:hypothetical protein
MEPKWVFVRDGCYECWWRGRRYTLRVPGMFGRYPLRSTEGRLLWRLCEGEPPLTHMIVEDYLGVFVTPAKALQKVRRVGGPTRT